MTQTRKTAHRYVNPRLTIIMTIMMVVVDICFVLISTGLNKYSAFSKSIFIGINVGILVVLLALNIFTIVVIRKRNPKLTVIAVVLCAAMGIAGVVGTYMIGSINKSVDKIASGDKAEIEESVEASIVIYDENITDVNQLEGRMVAYAPSTGIGKLGKKSLEDQKINAEFVEYDDSSAVLLALLGNEVDAAILPANYVNMFTNEAGFAEYLEQTSVVATYDGTVQMTATGTTGGKDLTSEPFTVLLTGTADGLADSIILVSVNPISLNVTMSSIARDSWVPITCHGGNSSKINSARASGVGCMISTVENLTGVKIDYYVDTNFKGVVAVVDALGGIIVNNPYEFVGQSASSERGHFTVFVPAGEAVTLSGEQALAFARERHLYATGDFQRQANQQQVISAMLQKVLRTRNVSTAMAVLNAAGDNITTSFTVDEIMTFFNYLMKKAERYYDDAHVENIINLIGSRYTGYNSDVWNEASQLSLSIVRVYEGAIKDNKAAIDRNINLNSEITAQKWTRWDATWDFYAPTIANEAYAEKIVHSETPESFYCQTTGGTWDGSNCSCPGGAEYVSRSGCKVDSPSNYGDAQSCTVAGFKWVEGQNYCASACPAGTTENNGYCKAGESGQKYHLVFLDCDKQTVLYTVDVESGQGAELPAPYNGYTWDSDAWKSNVTKEMTFYRTGCPVEPTATPETTPDPQQACEASGNVWYNGECKTKQEACALDGKVWENDSCRDKTPQEACQGYWYNDTCNPIPQEQAICEAGGGTWVDGACQPAGGEPTPAATEGQE